MRIMQIVRTRRAIGAVAIAAALWCGQVRAQVLEQVPADALAVFKIKNLDQTNKKVAKMAKDFGLDEMVPEMKDPLAALLAKGHISKGLDKAGDAALVVFGPDKDAKDAEEPVAVALVPVSDYDAFVGNFKKSDKGEGGEGISVVEDPAGGGMAMYIAHRGNYAVMSDKKSHLIGKGGLKLGALSAREADAKDFVFFLNMPVARKLAVPQIKDHRKDIIDEMDKTLAAQEQLKAYAPVFDTIVNKALDTAQEFLEEADSVMFTMNISDAGLAGGALVEFAPDSKFGKTVASIKPGSTPLLAGLPDKKYFFFGGGSYDGKVASDIAGEWLDPIAKSLKDTNTDAGKQIASLLDTMKAVASTSNHSASGMIVPTKPLGQESLIQISFGCLWRCKGHRGGGKEDDDGDE